MDPSHPLITIVGSLSFDLTSYTSRLPTAGETLTSTAFSTGCGGKGSNQAVATARMAQGNKLRVSMIGCVGDDTFGQTLRSGLGDEGIDVTHLRTIHGQTSGVANIIVCKTAQRNI